MAFVGLFAAAGPDAGSETGLATIAAGVVAVSGKVGADGGALIPRASRRLGRVSRLEIEIMEFRREALGGGFGWSGHQSRVNSYLRRGPAFLSGVGSRYLSGHP